MIDFIDRLLMDEAYAKLAHTESVDEIADLIELSGAWPKPAQEMFYRTAQVRLADLGVKDEDWEESEPRLAEFNPDQPRDEHGRWTDGAQHNWREEIPTDYNDRILEHQMGKAATLIARDHGFKGTVIVKDYDKSFQLAGKNFRSAGFYSPGTGDITLNRSSFKDLPARTFEGLVAHEVAHDAWHSVYGIAEESSYDPQAFDMLGKAGEFYTHVNENLEELRARDGVSDYSSAYWAEVQKLEDANDVNDQLYDTTMKLAINETLAETAKYLVAKRTGNEWLLNGRFRGVAPDKIWLDTYAKLKEAYKLVKHDA